MYRYAECGLPYIWLLDGYRLENTAYGPSLSIDDIDGLHRAIAHWAVDHMPRLCGREVRFLRLEMNLKQADLAARLGVGEQTVSLWERAPHKSIPAVADRLLRLMTEAWLDDDQPLARVMAHLSEVTNRKSVSRQSFRRIRRDWRAAA